MTPSDLIAGIKALDGQEDLHELARVFRYLANMFYEARMAGKRIVEDECGSRVVPTERRIVDALDFKEWLEQLAEEAER
jgi:hypothetical protein